MPTVSAVPQTNPSAKPPRPHGDACTIVLLGATGDLARRKLIGAIYDLARKYLVADGMRILGVDRDPLTDDEFREIARNALEHSDEVKHIPPADRDAIWQKLVKNLHYVGGDVTDS
jgi:glucose-6-phosphate 1-dehydrogenase